MSRQMSTNSSDFKFSKAKYLYCKFIGLSEEEREDFLSLIHRHFPKVYNIGTMTLHEKKVFRRGPIIE